MGIINRAPSYHPAVILILETGVDARTIQMYVECKWKDERARVCPVFLYLHNIIINYVC